jgi:hypothetical protein
LSLASQAMTAALPRDLSSPKVSPKTIPPRTAPGVLTGTHDPLRSWHEFSVLLQCLDDQIVKSDVQVALRVVLDCRQSNMSGRK